MTTTERHTTSSERSQGWEIPKLDTPPKAEQLFTGANINEAVIAVQNSTGVIIDEDWWSKNVGKAYNDRATAKRFDAAFEKEYEATRLRELGIPEEDITVIQSHEDGETAIDDEPLQINGINVPYEIAQSSEIDAVTWAAEEHGRRIDYVFRDAEYHLGRVFTVGNEVYEVDSISYTGLEGDYETLTIAIKNLDTGKVTYDLETEKVDAMIATGERTPEVAEAEQVSEEQDTDIETVKLQELTLFDTRYPEALPEERQEFQAFLDTHPSLLTIPANMPDDIETSPYEPATTAKQVIAKLALRHPLPDEFKLELAEEARQEAYGLAA